jgi:hypothetical protein
MALFRHEATHDQESGQRADDGGLNRVWRRDEQGAQADRRCKRPAARDSGTRL